MSVENHPGAGSTAAPALVAKSPASHMLLVHTSTLAYSAALLKNPGGRVSKFPFNTVRVSMKPSKAKPGRKLKAARAKFGNHRTWFSEVRIGRRSPELVGAVCRIRTNKICSVLDIVHNVLLKVRVIKDVEGLGPQHDRVTFSEMEVSGHAEIEISKPRASKRIKSLSGNN